MRLFSHREAARFYDMLGARLDTQAFYEAAALRELLAGLELKRCRSVVEFGCGTGRLAAELLGAHLSSDATYLGVDVSATMVALTKARLRQFGRRVEVRHSDGAPRIEAPDGAFDRFISTYVLDLLAKDDIHAILGEAHRVLVPEGLLGLASLTNGPGPISGLVTTIWRELHRLSPWLVGGCRPIAIRASLPDSDWRIVDDRIVVRFGIPSEIVVAKPVPAPALPSRRPP